MKNDNSTAHLTTEEMALLTKKEKQFGAGRSNNHQYGEPSFWLKGDEVLGAKSGLLTVILRLDDRSDPQQMPNQWLPTLLPVPLYFITVPGNQAAGVSAKFEKDDGTTVLIQRRVVKPLSDIADGDLFFGNGSAVPECATDVPKFLNEMFSPGNPVSLDRLVTLYYVEYTGKEVPASDPVPV